MSIFPSRTIARYTARMFLIRSLSFLAALVLIVQTLDLLGESGDILAVPGNGEAELWHYVALRLPQLVALFLPFSVLLGTLVTLMSLNSNSEVVIFKAAGISAHQILAPLVAAALGIAAVNFVFNETVLVKSYAAFDGWKKAAYDPKAMHAPGRTEVWVRSGGDLFHATAVAGDGAGTRLRGVDIYRRVNDRLATIIRADSATVRPGGWELTHALAFDVATGHVARDAALAWPGPPPAQFTTGAVVPEHTPFWRLLPAIRAMRDAGRPADNLIASLNHKIAGPLSATLMPLLGAIAAFGLARSGQLFLRAVAGMMLGFAFFVADNFSLAMAEFGSIPPVIAAWAPFVLFLLIGETVLLRSEE